MQRFVAVSSAKVTALLEIEMYIFISSRPRDTQETSMHRYDEYLPRGAALRCSRYWADNDT